MDVAVYFPILSHRRKPDSILPEEFWRRIYNVGGGPSCRFVYLDFMKHMMNLFHLGDHEKIMDLNWFATQNFHDAWFGDSWVLNEYTGHWRDSLDDYYAQVGAES